MSAMIRLRSMRLRRVAAEVSMDDIMERLPHIGRTPLYNIELGSRKVSEGDAAVIAEILGCTLTDLKKPAKVVPA